MTLDQFKEMQKNIEKEDYHANWKVAYSPYLDQIKLCDWRMREIHPFNDRGTYFTRHRILSSDFVVIGDLKSECENE